MFRCNGALGTCPPTTIVPIHMQNGQVSLTLSTFDKPVMYQSSTERLLLKLSDFSTTCGSLTVRWSLLEDEESCRLNMNNETISSNTNNHILVGLSLQNTHTYKVVVQVINIREQFGLPVCSNPVTIDTSTPTGGWAYDGLGSTDLQYQSRKTFGASWGGFQSTHGIGKYEVAMHYQTQSSPNRTEVQGFLNVHLNGSFVKNIEVIPDGSNLTTNVRAYTKAGLYKEVSTNGVIVDTSSPLTGSISDGTNLFSDMDYADWTSSYTVSWEPFTDPHTPIANYNVGVKRKNGGLVSSGLIAVGLVSQFEVRSLALVSEEEYCAVVEGENAAGLKAQVQSNCLLIDHDAPRYGTVNDGTFEDIDYQSGDTVFYANWNGFDDGVRGSGLIEYLYILTNQSDMNITSWTSAGLQTNITISGLILADSTTYYITVRAVDKVGNYKDVKSDGVYIDTTHPVYTGEMTIEGETAQKDKATVVYISNKDPVTATWPQFVDEHSGMWKYQWSIVKDHEQQTEWKDVPGVNLATRAVFRYVEISTCFCNHR